jgi:uncharacterized protein YcbX
MLIGKIKEIWRYPVKSLGGGILESVNVHEHGIAGDRGWALIDGESGDICSAKKLSNLLNLMATYESEPCSVVVYGDRIPPVTIRFPDGRECGPTDNQAAAVSEFSGRPLKLQALEPPENLDHYRMSEPPSEEEFLRALNVKPGEDGPDLSDYDPNLIQTLMEYACPPGNYFDVFPLHLLTTAALEHMSAESGEIFDHRRFRPNLFVETLPSIEGIAEFDWVGRCLQIGNVLLKVESRTIRCSMPSREQANYGLAQNAKISKSLYVSTNRYLGVNLTVVNTGLLRAGDEVELVD